MLEIWTNWIMPILTAIVGLSGVVACWRYLFKSKIETARVAKETAKGIVDGLKGKITVEINDIVEKTLKGVITPMEAIDKKRELGNTAIITVLEELSKLWSKSSAISPEQKESIKQAILKAYEANKIEPNEFEYEFEPKSKIIKRG